MLTVRTILDLFLSHVDALHRIGEYKQNSADVLRNGADLKVAADIAGHHDLDVTRSIYGRPLATLDARAAVNDFAARIGASRTARRLEAA